MAPSSKTKKRGGRRKSSSSRAYPNITYNRETGIFTIRVLGHVRTATSDAVALWERDDMFRQYAPERECLVCGRMFKPTTSLAQRVCSDDCTTAVQTSRQRARDRKVRYTERYLYQREETWIAEPHDAHIGVRLKATFQSKQEAREYIAVVMNSTSPWRMKRCRDCGREFDWYEEGLLARTPRCASCGGVAYQYRPGTRTKAISECRSCGKRVESGSQRKRAYCDDCLPAAEVRSHLTCLRCGDSFQRTNPNGMYCDPCRTYLGKQGQMDEQMDEAVSSLTERARA